MESSSNHCVRDRRDPGQVHLRDTWRQLFSLSSTPGTRITKSTNMHVFNLWDDTGVNAHVQVKNLQTPPGWDAVLQPSHWEVKALRPVSPCLFILFYLFFVCKTDKLMSEVYDEKQTIYWHSELKSKVKSLPWSPRFWMIPLIFLLSIKIFPCIICYDCAFGYLWCFLSTVVLTLWSVPCIRKRRSSRTGFFNLLCPAPSGGGFV